MAFIIFLFFILKKFEKVEKTGIISTKFLLQCTPSVILGINLITNFVYFSKCLKAQTDYSLTTYVYNGVLRCFHSISYNFYRVNPQSP